MLPIGRKSVHTKDATDAVIARPQHQRQRRPQHGGVLDLVYSNHFTIHDQKHWSVGSCAVLNATRRWQCTLPDPLWLDFNESDPSQGIDNHGLAIADCGGGFADMHIAVVESGGWYGKEQLGIKQKRQWACVGCGRHNWC